MFLCILWIYFGRILQVARDKENPDLHKKFRYGNRKLLSRKITYRTMKLVVPLFV